MKSFGVTSVLLPVLLLASLSAGEAQVRPVLLPGALCSDQPDAAIATFEDANLEAAIRTALSVGVQEDLTCGLVAGLTDLTAQSAGIESPVQDVRISLSLTTLNLRRNAITDISALGGLKGLTELDLEDNPTLTDIQPLLDNTGLGAGDRVGLSYTSVSCAELAALAAKGVTVTCVPRVFPTG